MTPEQITQWARESGAEQRKLSTIFYSRTNFADFAAKVAAHAAAHEREECAKVCDGFDACDPKYIAAAIRARTMAARPGEKYAG